MKGIFSGDNQNVGWIFELEAALEKARDEEVPTYAPALFAEAVELHKKAQQLWQEYEPIEQIRKQLQLAMEALDKAKEVSKVSKESLSQIVETRIEINQNEGVRYHSPTKLNEAEYHYREAIRQAESGDIDIARRSAALAQHIYREATLQALEMGPIKNLENQLKYYERFLPRKRHKEAARELSALKIALEKAKTGDLSLSMLRGKIAVGGSEISQFLESKPDSGLDTDFIPPGGLQLHPDTYKAPKPPVTMRITERTANSLSLRWKDNSGFDSVNQLERQEEDGLWEVVAEWGPLSGWQTYTDVDLEPDTQYCYRIRVENSFGANVTPQPKRAYGYTRDGNNLSVWRVQLTIRTADVPHAGTGDDVRVRLNSPVATNSPSGNGTWLDYGPDFTVSGVTLVVSDDFYRGREFTYDLNLTSIGELSDITMISILKEGSDELGIAELSLNVNGVQVYEKHFGETTSTVQWINEGDGYSPIYTIFHSELRAHESWQAYIDSPPTPSLQISNDEIVSRLEGMIGDRIHGTQLKWGKLYGRDWVEATQADDHTLHVDLDLLAEAFGHPEVDIDFDLRFNIECDAETATLMVTTLNFDPAVIYSLFYDIVTLGIVEFLEDAIEGKIQASWQPIADSFDIPTGGLCPGVEVDEDGNVNFILS